MEISTKDLRKRPGQVLKIVNSGEDVVVTYRGKPSVVITQIKPAVSSGINDDPAFGIWSDDQETETVDAFVRNLRKGRTIDR